jgi:hypothetical protein
MAIRIPDPDKDKLAAVLKLKPEELDQLYQLLQDARPRLHILDLATDLREKSSIDGETLAQTMRLLSTLYWIKGDQQFEAEELAEEVCAAAQSSGDLRLADAPGGWDSFKVRLASLLSLERTVGITAKAAYVAYQCPRHLHSSRILTDARPVFLADPSQEPAAFVINHTLQLEVHEDGADKEWFVALDPSDLRGLQDVIDRAMEKEESLRSLLAKTGVPTLSWEAAQ